MTLLSTNEACKFLGISRRTMFKLCDKRLIEYFNMPGGFRFAPEALERYVESCKVPSTEAEEDHEDHQ